MSTIRVFEPALCCNTGVCGTDVDQALVDFTSDVKFIQAAGGDISRTNLGTDPEEFTKNPMAVAFVQKVGSEGLPLTIVDDVTVLTGRYPTREELSSWADLSDRTQLPVEQCCTPDDCCTDGDEDCCTEEERGTCCPPETKDSASECCGGDTSCC